MAVLSNTMLQGTAAISDESDTYQIEKSLRFNEADSSHLEFDPGLKGNRRTWTWAGWIKRTNPGNNDNFVGWGRADGTNYGGACRFESDGTIRYFFNGAGTQKRTNAVYRDPSAWYHIVAVLDTTNSTASERQRLYVNGVQVTSFSSDDVPNQNDELGNEPGKSHLIGCHVDGSKAGYLQC